MALASKTGRNLVRALVAEDDPGVRRLIVGLLARDGWEAHEAKDGQAVADATTGESVERIDGNDVVARHFWPRDRITGRASRR